MTLSKSTRYALYAALEMAIAGGQPVTVAGVARRHRIPPTALAKVFQQLVRSGIATSSRGIGGGFRLARSRSQISVLDVIAVFEPPRRPGERLLGEPRDSGDGEPSGRALRLLFDEVDELVRSTYASVSLETLARPATGRAKEPIGQ